MPSQRSFRKVSLLLVLPLLLNSAVPAFALKQTETAQSAGAEELSAKLKRLDGSSIITRKTDLARQIRSGGTLFTPAEGVLYIVSLVARGDSGLSVQARTSDGRPVPGTRSSWRYFSPDSLLGYEYRDPVSNPAAAAGLEEEIYRGPTAESAILLDRAKPVISFVPGMDFLLIAARGPDRRLDGNSAAFIRLEADGRVLVADPAAVGLAWRETAEKVIPLQREVRLPAGVTLGSNPAWQVSPALNAPVRLPDSALTVSPPPNGTGLSFGWAVPTSRSDDELGVPPAYLLFPVDRADQWQAAVDHLNGLGIRFLGALQRAQISQQSQRLVGVRRVFPNRAETTSISPQTAAGFLQDNPTAIVYPNPISRDSVFLGPAEGQPLILLRQEAAEIQTKLAAIARPAVSGLRIRTLAIVVSDSNVRRFFVNTAQEWNPAAAVIATESAPALRLTLEALRLRPDAVVADLEVGLNVPTAMIGRDISYPVSYGKIMGFLDQLNRQVPGQAGLEESLQDYAAILNRLGPATLALQARDILGDEPRLTNIQRRLPDPALIADARLAVQKARDPSASVPLHPERVPPTLKRFLASVWVAEHPEFLIDQIPAHISLDLVLESRQAVRLIGDLVRQQKINQLYAGTHSLQGASLSNATLVGKLVEQAGRNGQVGFRVVEDAPLPAIEVILPPTVAATGLPAGQAGLPAGQAGAEERSAPQALADINPQLLAFGFPISEDRIRKAVWVTAKTKRNREIGVGGSLVVLTGESRGEYRIDRIDHLGIATHRVSDAAAGAPPEVLFDRRAGRLAHRYPNQLIYVPPATTIRKLILVPSNPRDNEIWSAAARQVGVALIPLSDFTRASEALKEIRGNSSGGTYAVVVNAAVAPADEVSAFIRQVNPGTRAQTVPLAVQAEFISNFPSEQVTASVGIGRQGLGISVKQARTLFDRLDAAAARDSQAGLEESAKTPTLLAEIQDALTRLDSAQVLMNVRGLIFAGRAGLAVGVPFREAVDLQGARIVRRYVAADPEEAETLRVLGVHTDEIVRAWEPSFGGSVDAAIGWVEARFRANNILAVELVRTADRNEINGRIRSLQALLKPQNYDADLAERIAQTLYDFFV